MKNFLILAVLLVISACSDGKVKDGVLTLRETNSFYSNDVALTNKSIGNVSYGYVEVEFEIVSGLEEEGYLGIILRASDQNNYYSCGFVAAAAGDADPGDSSGLIKMTAGIMGLVQGEQFPQQLVPYVIPNFLLASEFVGTHTMGCEVVKVQEKDMIRLYLDSTLMATYEIGSDAVDATPLGAGKVGLGGRDQGGAPGDSLKIRKFSYFESKP